MSNQFNSYRKEAIRGYIQAADLLPETLWQAAFSIPDALYMKAEEYRLRIGQPLTLTVDGIPYPLDSPTVTEADLQGFIAKVTRCSLHSYDQQMRQGFITARGGHRIGLCGMLAETPKGSILRKISSANVRIARQYSGIGERLAAELFTGSGLCSVLLLSSPGVGKTTLLRDLCRILSLKYRIAVADCRFELGAEGYDLGQSDVMQGGQKRQVIDMLVRSMSPACVAVDEITAVEDTEAIIEAGHVGVSFLATAHGASIEDVLARPLYYSLMNQGIFEKIVLLERTEAGRAYRIFERRSKDDKNDWTCHDRHLLLNDGIYNAAGDGETQTDAAGSYCGAGTHANGNLF